MHYVSALLAAGTPVHVVSRRLGHASPVMTLQKLVLASAAAPPLSGVPARSLARLAACTRSDCAATITAFGNSKILAIGGANSSSDPKAPAANEGYKP
jgi:hypothetical protein